MNDHQARQQARANQRLEFLKALGAGQVVVMDRFGSVLKPGDRLLWHCTVDPVVEVQAIGPNLNDNAPIGQMLVTLAVTIPVAVMANQPWQTFVLMGSSQEQPVSDDKAMDAVSEATRAAAKRIDAADRFGRDIVPEGGPSGLVDAGGRSLDDPPL